jgi:hypothetical protein
MNNFLEPSLRLGKNLAFAAVPIVLGLSAPPIMAQNTIKLHNGSQILGIDETAKDPKVSKVGHDLLAIYNEYQAYQKQADAKAPGVPAFKSSNSLARIVEEHVVIDAVAAGDPKVLASELEKLGLKGVAVLGSMVSGRLPISAIPALKTLEALKFARPAYAVTKTGSVDSQGDAAMRSDLARALFGVDGTGVIIGTLSDSFDCLGGAAAGVASGDLPAGITVLAEGPCPESSDEGRGMMELIHDVAPGAAQAFHTAVNGQADFAQGIIDLANAGAKVINDDIGYPDEPFFQDGIITQAIDQVKAMGVAYFSAAGNVGRQSYESAFRPSGQFADIGFGPEELHDFDPGTGVDICQQITIPEGETLILSFQWDQPFFSVSGAPGSASDMDIVLANAACDTVLESSAEANIGGDPVEVFSFTNFRFTNPAGSGVTTFNLVILKFVGPNPDLMKTVNSGSGSFAEFDTASGTSVDHSNALGGLGVGAAFYQQTPEFGTSPPVIEDFSSAGGTPILFDIAGNRLSTPEIREQPDITAPDGTDTTFFGGSDVEDNGFPNFFGTSAAAPHAAAVAALLKDLDDLLSPDAIYEALKATAIDMDDPSTPGFDTSFDFGTGHGFIQADAALAEVASPP